MANITSCYTSSLLQERECGVQLYSIALAHNCCGLSRNSVISHQRAADVLAHLAETGNLVEIRGDTSVELVLPVA